MIIPFFILSLFFLLAVPSYIEDRMAPTLRWGIFFLVGFVMIVMAGFRPIGLDPDSESYEDYFLNVNNLNLMDAVELSYIWICEIFRFFCDDVHLVFLVYAILAVTIKLYALSFYNTSVILLLTGYLCYYYPLHELMQIRSGVLGGFILLAIPFLADRKLLKTAMLFFLGSIFHTSGLALFPLLVLRNRFTTVGKIVWAAFIPVCYVAGTLLNDLSLFYGIPYIGSKLERYASAFFSGTRFLDVVYIFSPVQLLSIFVFYYLLIFADGCKQVKYLPLLLKIFAIGIGSYVLLQAFPPIAERISMLYRIVMVVLIPYMSYTVRPKWAGITMALLTEFIFLNFMLRYVFNFTLFLKVNP